jgi:hypothetical protein
VLAITTVIVYKCIRRRRSAGDVHHEEGTTEPEATGLANIQHPEKKEKHEGEQAAHTLSELPSPHPYQGEKHESEHAAHTISELPSPVAEMDGGTVWKDR